MTLLNIAYLATAILVSLGGIAYGTLRTVRALKRRWISQAEQMRAQKDATRASRELASRVRELSTDVRDLKTHVRSLNARLQRGGL